MNYPFSVFTKSQNGNATSQFRFLMALRLMVAGILLIAAVSKLAALNSFLQSMVSTGLPSDFIFPVAVTLIGLEIIVAALLCNHRTAHQGALIGVVLFAAFTIYTGSRVMAGAPDDCACFGVFLKLPPPVILVVDFLLCASCVVIFRRESFYGASQDINLIAQARGNSNFSSIRLPALFCVLLLCGIIFASVLPQDPILQEALTRPFRSILGITSPNPIAEAIRKNDPPLMSFVPVVTAPGIDMVKPTLVVMSGDCSLCALSTLVPLEQIRSRQRGVNFIMVSSTGLNAMREFSKRYHLNFPLLHDERSRLKAAFNAQWSPRVYLVSPSGKLLWKQDAVRVSAQEVEQAIISVTGGSNYEQNR